MTGRSNRTMKRLPLIHPLVVKPWGVFRKLKILCAFLAASLFFQPSAQAGCFHADVRPGPGCTRQGLVSDYFPPLKGTAMDTAVFFLEGDAPGPTALVLGGTHANEPAGIMAAKILVEHGAVIQGRLIVVVHANPSAASVPDTRCPVPYRHELPGTIGPRYLTYGDRWSDPLDHGLDLQGTGQDKQLRNLNRVWPGDPSGTPTQQLAHALFVLIRAEQPVFLVDYHESRTEGRGDDRDKYRLANSLITPPTGIETGACALLDMEEDTGISLKLEESGPAFKGMSHWEVGSRTGCIPFLTESPNPGQDDWRHNPDVIQDPDFPLKHRVGIHLRMLVHLAAGVQGPQGKHLILQNIPEYRQLMDRGVGGFLN